MCRYIALVPLLLQLLSPGTSPAAEASGAGSTFAAPIIEKWSAAYKAVSGDRVSYQPVGSSIGVDMIKKAAVDFGTTDRPLSRAELKKLNMLQFPLAIGGVVPVVNVQGILPGQMRFTGPVLADIFLGKIRRWDHPGIRSINAELVLPNLPITVVHRLDGSGTTFNWTNYLSKISTDWNTKVGQGNSVDWPLGLGGKGNNGVASLVAMVPGAIGYLEYSYALQKFDRISFGSVQNGSGHFAMPTVASFRAAAENADWKAAEDFAVILADAPGADAYPIAATTYVLMPRKPAWSKSETSALAFLRWALEHGQAHAEALNYVPLPSKLVKQIEAYLDAGPAQQDDTTVAKGN